MNHKLVLKNKKRFTAFIFLLLFFTATTFYASHSYGYREPQYKTVMVKYGDTLWDIAKTNANNSDIRKYIFKIKKLNCLSDSNIYPGITLKLPN